MWRTQKKIWKHKKYSIETMNGNDCSFENYLRKKEKLTKSRYGGLDIEGYKDYISNKAPIPAAIALKTLSETLVEIEKFHKYRYLWPRIGAELDPKF